MTREQAAEQATSIKKIVIGAIISEYGAVEIRDRTKQELKQKVNLLANAAQGVQKYFLTHPNCTDSTRKDFKQEFNRDELYLLSEILLVLWGVPYDDLEQILFTLKENIQDTVESF
jgi:Fe-S oxidoreductase